MIGKGPGNTGAVWVARKIPDGYISAHANAARITTFPLDDPENTLYAEDVISFARDKGYFEGDDGEFSFADAYNPDSYGSRRFCDARVWCMYRRAAPSNELSADWVMGVEDAERLPLWIKPDRKLSVADVMGFMRDHFEGTDLDMTNDVGAGPYDLPYRWRPLTWKVEEEKFFNERAVSTQQTGFSFVAQSRAWLPDPIGGVLWFSVDDTFSTVYFPAYCGIHATPRSYAVGTGSFHDVTWDAAFWVFNYVSNFVYLRYADMIRDVQVVQQDLEARFLAEQSEVDAAALVLYEQAPRLAREYLTQYTTRTGDEVVERWRELGKFLLYKYLDGNVKTATGKVTHPGYPEQWYRELASATGDHLRMRKMPAEEALEAKKKEEAREMADAVLKLLAARGVDVDDEPRGKIEETDDLVKLKQWLVKAATAESAGEVIAEE
jgi:dipeptidase